MRLLSFDDDTKAGVQCFSVINLARLFKGQIRPVLEYSSHGLRSSNSFALLHAVHKRDIPVISSSDI